MSAALEAKLTQACFIRQTSIKEWILFVEYNLIWWDFEANFRIKPPSVIWWPDRFKH